MRRGIQLSLLVAIPLASFLGTLGVLYARDRWLGTAPVLECVDRIDLGARERGQIAATHFRVKNAGRGLLTLDGFQTSCSCAGVEADLDGQPVRVQSVRLSPGEEAELTVRVAVGAPVGHSQFVQVFFNTNDPARPTWQIDVLIPQVRGACMAEPAAVVFGALSPGQGARQVVNLYDNGVNDSAVREVRTTHPERFTVRLLPLTEQDKRLVHATAGSLIGRIEVTARTEEPGPLDGEILVAFADKAARADPIPVVGEVRGLARCWPRALVLPRHSSDGLRYGDELLVAGRDEKPIQVTVVSVPSGISADATREPDRPDRWLLHAQRHAGHPKGARNSAASSIRLRVVCDGRDEELEVPVLVAEGQS